jgi:hypothetical protein
MNSRTGPALFLCFALLLCFALSAPGSRLVHAEAALAPAAKNCHFNASNDMVCDGVDTQGAAPSSLGTLDPLKIKEEEKKQKDSKPVPVKDIPVKDYDTELKELEAQVKAIADAMPKLQEAFDSIYGTPDEVAYYKGLLAKTMNEKSQSGELPGIMQGALSSGGGSGTDFLKALASGLGLTSKFRDPDINPASKFAAAYNFVSSEGGVGYNPYANGGQPVVPDGSQKEGAIPTDTSGGLCIYNSGGQYSGDPGAIPDATFKAIFHGTKQQIDPNLITMLSSVYTALKQCNQGKNVCMQIDDGFRPQGYGCGKPGVSCNSNHSRGQAVDFTVKSLPYTLVRNTAWCAGGYKGEVGDESALGYGHIHMGTTKQGAWSRPRGKNWNNFTCDAYHCDAHVSQPDQGAKSQPQ